MDKIIGNYGRLDILVNNAGITGRDLGENDIEKVQLDHWKAVLDINLTGVMLGSQFAIKNINKFNGSGVILNIG